MKKILPIFIFLLSLFSLTRYVNAQEGLDCERTRDQASYKCLTGWTACYYPCVDQTKDNSACADKCKREEDACDAQVVADFRACKAAKTESEVQKVEEGPPVQNSPEVEKGKTLVDGKGSGILDQLGINPYQMWLNFRELFEFQEIIAREGGSGLDFESFVLNLAGKKSRRQKEAEIMESPAYKAREEWARQYRQQGQIDTKTEAAAWKEPAPKGEVKIVEVIEATDTKRYSWDSNSGAVMQSGDWEKIKFKEPVRVGEATSREVELLDGWVEVKVRNNKPEENQFGVDAGWLGVTVSRTHFWVLKDEESKSAVVVVYEGEVVVTTKDGKAITVSPKDGEPGIAAIRSKPSWLKVALAGGILAAVVGGVALILRKKPKK